MAFSDRLRFYLREKHMTQQALAQRVGRKQCTVFRWLSGQSVPRLSTVTVVADVLGVTVNDLLEDGRKHYCL